jgi:ribose 5-phosphate isomerase A
MDEKQAVALEAAKLVQSGMVLGLGTGSTTSHFVREIGRKVRDEGLKVACVSSSFSCSVLAKEQGILLIPVDQVSRLDLYVDGADEVAPDKALIKGRGGAMVSEKLLAQACDRFIVIVDQGKLVDKLGSNFPVPVEVIPSAWLVVQKVLRALGGTPTLRQAVKKDGPVVTDHGNLILDTVFPTGVDWDTLDFAINAIPGVLDHGLFLAFRKKTQVLVGAPDGVRPFP